MPELPEVETVRRTLERLVIGKRIARVELFYAPLIKKVSVAALAYQGKAVKREAPDGAAYPDDPFLFREILRGETFRAIKRRGKFLILETDRLSLVSHLRMEGRYALKSGEEAPDTHTHVIFYFTDNSALHYRDVRKFGTFHLFAKGEEGGSLPLEQLGPEPLDPAFTQEHFMQMIKGKTTRLKPLLLDQHFLVGLGNIYVDEALFRARLNPERTADKLTRAQKIALYESIVETLKAAVAAGGSSVRSYLNGNGEMGMFQLQIQVYGQTGRPCPRCATPIRKTVVAGRGTHYCLRCQPTPRQRLIRST